jgi:predicted small integral membrane protein
MKNKINFLKKSVMLGIMTLALAVLGNPEFSYASTYAYVNHVGEVRSVDAATPQNAINTAPSIGVHSGVMLLNTFTGNDIIGDQVTGF